MENKIDIEKIKEAKAKLACHIEPPKGSAFAAALAAENNSGEKAETGSSCGAAAAPAPGEKIRLTEMTSAGG